MKKARTTPKDPEATLDPARRSVRRHHRERMIAHAQRSRAASVQDAAARLEWGRRNHNHLKACSCWMCGNPRKYENLPPVQERRLMEAAREEAASKE